MRLRALKAGVCGWVGIGWRYLRAVSGDDAYERYLRHRTGQRCGESLSAKAFFIERERRKWSGVTRCC